MSQKEEQQQRGEQRRLARVERLRQELEEAQAKESARLTARLENNKIELRKAQERRLKLDARIEVLENEIDAVEGELETPAEADARDETAVELDIEDAPEVGHVDPTRVRRGA